MKPRSWCGSTYKLSMDLQYTALGGLSQLHPLSPLELVRLKVYQVSPNNMTEDCPDSSGTHTMSLLAWTSDPADSLRASSAMVYLFVPLFCLSLMSHGCAALILPSSNLPSPNAILPPALPTVPASDLNGTLHEVHDWPAPSTRYPLFNYDDGFLMFRDYGVDGSKVRLFQGYHATYYF